MTAVEAWRVVKHLEWSASTWTDYATCPCCGALWEGIADGPRGEPGNLPKTHMPDCEWVKLLAFMENNVVSSPETTQGVGQD